ncbi:hypothetical protein AI27_08860 [Sphingomonas sp. BHC-A]|nr:hypothetical protein AI27_08860 [Sphingomonas sp. BHC-A]
MSRCSGRRTPGAGLLHRSTASSRSRISHGLFGSCLGRFPLLHQVREDAILLAKLAVQNDGLRLDQIHAKPRVFNAKVEKVHVMPHA